AAKLTLPTALIVLTTHSMVLTLSYQTEVARNDFLISSDNTRRALRSRAHLREEPDTTPACREKKSVPIL
ncbi:MAG TPA: hypothetical protein VFW91_17065, partial [Candidatus Binatia bacterium]|nr:hypothetical protein [Candidatus Binatia bacterium]